jgi:DNA (cytosine-5)-methyltransferase 1
VSRVSAARLNTIRRVANSSTPPYKVVSLFSGAGGMDAGLEGTGRFVTLACAEKEGAFCDTLEANRAAGRLGGPDTVIFRGAIEDLDPTAVLDACKLRPGELDVLAGGPPCQTFSTAGRRATVADPRGLLLWEFLRFVEALQPKYFVMENVRGLLSAAIQHRKLADRPDKGGPPLRPEEAPGSVVDRWLSDLRSMTDGAYRVDCFEVNAVNYGAPQLRERVLFVGNRLGQVIDFPAPTHSNPHREQSPSLLDDAELPPFRTLGEALETVADDDGEVMDFSPRKKEFLALVPEGSNWRSLPKEIQQESMGRAWHAKGGRSGWWRRLSRDLTCPTVVTMPNHASTAMCHPTETRALTLRECAAVQEFPNSWTFCGTTAQKYAQVGNALPVRLAEVAGEVLAAQLDRGDAPDPEAVLAGDYRRVYLRSHVRTRQWYRAGVVYVWADGEDNSHAHYSAAGRQSVGAV